MDDLLNEYLGFITPAVSHDREVNLDSSLGKIFRVKYLCRIPRGDYYATEEVPDAPPERVTPKLSAAAQRFMAENIGEVTLTGFDADEQKFLDNAYQNREDLPEDEEELTSFFKQSIQKWITINQMIELFHNNSPFFVVDSSKYETIFQDLGLYLTECIRTKEQSPNTVGVSQEDLNKMNDFLAVVKSETENKGSRSSIFGRRVRVRAAAARPNRRRIKISGFTQPEEQKQIGEAVPNNQVIDSFGFDMDEMGRVN